MSIYDGLALNYDLGMLPLESFILKPLRRRLFPFLTGQILELGVGTGVNLPLYSQNAHVAAIDASLDMISIAKRRHSEAAVAWSQADAANLPFADGSFDNAVGSLVFCSIVDVQGALYELQRVLRPAGWLVLLEHVRGERGLRRRLTDLLAGPWLRISKSCHLNRDTAQAVADAGFEVVCASRHAFGFFQLILARAPVDGPAVPNG